MKNALVALVIDQDPESLKRFLPCVEGIFATVYTQSDPTRLERDYQGLKPQVIFLNLNLDHREESFNFLEKVHPTQETPAVVFAYLDHGEPELFAHAIENGVQDLFTRPFDADLIASKINRWIRNEQSLEKDLSYTRLRPALKAQVELGLKLLCVDESGFTMSSDHYISKGTRLPVCAPLLKEIFGAPDLELLVTKTWYEEGQAECYLFLEPRAASEATSSALRRFILSKL